MALVSEHSSLLASLTYVRQGTGSFISDIHLPVLLYYAEHMLYAMCLLPAYNACLYAYCITIIGSFDTQWMDGTP